MKNADVKFIDTNIFLRLITNDDLGKALKVKALFEEVQLGKEIVFSSESIIAEIVFILSHMKKEVKGKECWFDNVFCFLGLGNVLIW